MVRLKIVRLKLVRLKPGSDKDSSYRLISLRGFNLLLNPVFKKRNHL
jgi:hypothetical protein